MSKKLTDYLDGVEVRKEDEYFCIYLDGKLSGKTKDGELAYQAANEKAEDRTENFSHKYYYVCPVICVETGTLFENMKTARIEFGLTQGELYRALRYGKPTKQGYHFIKA